METNSPYYQNHSQFTNDTNAPFPAVPTDEYDIPGAGVDAPHHDSQSGEKQVHDSHIQSLDAENNHLFGLLEAANTARVQVSGDMNTEAHDTAKETQNRNKRKRSPYFSLPSGDPAASASSHAQTEEPDRPHKRARTDLMSTDPQLRASSDALLGEARAAGVHSAAALFRRSSKEPTRKYTRPPMSKLFMSLQVTPENFLQLQARAKAYMLDPAHPDRQSCVGSRGKSDTDMVKLKLFNCVQAFLADGVGEQFFGEHVEKPAENETLEAARALGEDAVAVREKLVWPRDGNKIISLVTPLLRRMVTNERQRMYAIQTRKGGRKSESSSGAPQNQDIRPVAGGHQRPESRESQSHSIIHNSPSISNDTYPLTQPHQYTDPNQTLSYRPLAHSLSARNSVEHHGMDTSHHSTRPRPLPTAQERFFDLRKIILILSKNNLKLKHSTRIRGPGPLIYYSWDMLRECIAIQLQHTVSTYPELGGEFSAGTSSGQSASVNAEEGMRNDTLRGLAVAATEMQNTNATSEQTVVGSAGIPAVPPTDEASGAASIDAAASETPPATDQSGIRAKSHTPPQAVNATGAPSEEPTRPTLEDKSSDLKFSGPCAQPPEQASQHTYPGLVLSRDSAPDSDPQQQQPKDTTRIPDGHSLPRYIIKAMLAGGLTELKNQDEWEKAKERVGYAIWADGRLTVVVEII